MLVLRFCTTFIQCRAELKARIHNVANAVITQLGLVRVCQRVQSAIAVQ